MYTTCDPLLLSAVAGTEDSTSPPRWLLTYLLTLTCLLFFVFLFGFNQIFSENILTFVTFTLKLFAYVEHLTFSF